MSFWVTIKFSKDFNWVSKKNYSTNTCLWHLTDKITTKFEKIHFHWNDFNWFKKSIWHHWPPNFTKKIKYLGFPKIAIAQFQFYLCEPKFKINVNISYSSLSNLLCGIPQGSILCPHLFLLYKKWLVPSCCQWIATLNWWYSYSFQHKSKIEIEKQLIRDLLSLCDWFVDNKSSIHFGEDKTVNTIWY